MSAEDTQSKTRAFQMKRHSRGRREQNMIVKRLRGGWVRWLAAPVAAFFTLLVTSGALFAQPPAIAKSFNPSGVAIGQTSILTFTITNPSGSAITAVAFTDTFPVN